MTVLGLYCCASAFSSCGERGLLSTRSAQASHCSGFSCCRAQEHGLSSCGAQAQLPHSLHDLPESGRFLTNGPRGSPRLTFNRKSMTENWCRFWTNISLRQEPVMQSKLWHDQMWKVSPLISNGIRGSRKALCSAWSLGEIRKPFRSKNKI